jgi:hypothetical protein
MTSSRPLNCLALAAAVTLLLTPSRFQAQPEATKSAAFPYPEKLSYRIKWKMITAGTALVDLTRDANVNGWQTNLHLQSEGMVNRLYKVLDTYRSITSPKFCGNTSYLDAQEGKKHTITRLTFESGLGKVEYDERDLVKNSTVKKELDIPPCTYDITGAFATIREIDLPPGKWATLPVTDGKKVASVKVEAQAKEAVQIGGKTYQTIRYEAFLFDNVLYRKKGRLLMWITDDAERIPVQMRLQMGFPIGTVNIELEKQQKT